jgi:hypothetical protein
MQLLDPPEIQDNAPDSSLCVHWRNSTMQQETPDLKQKKNLRNASSNDMTAAANMYVQKGTISRVTGLVFIQILFIINYCM